MKYGILSIILVLFSSVHVQAQQIKFLCEGWQETILGEKIEVATVIEVSNDSYHASSMKEGLKPFISDGFASVSENSILLYEEKKISSRKNEVNRISGEFIFSRYTRARTAAYEVFCIKAEQKF